MTTEETVERIKDALRYYHEHKGNDPARWALVLRAVARRYRLNTVILRYALETERELRDGMDNQDSQGNPLRPL